MLFCGFVIGDKMPDASTLYRFRSKLAEGGTLATMFAEVERQLDIQGIKVRPAQGALVEIGIVKANHSLWKKRV
jgi:IS5 family transposase